MSLSDTDGAVICDHCETPYAYEKNMLDGQYLWVRRCKAACKRKNPQQKPRFESADTNTGASE